MKYLRLGAGILFLFSLIWNIYAGIQYDQGRKNDPPVIECAEDVLELSVSDSSHDLLTGMHAYDTQDGDLTDKIMVASTSHFLEPGTLKVQYVVFDSTHNAATLTRHVHYTDYEPPRFSLSEPLVYRTGENIRYLNYVTARDVLDGDITDRIRVKSSYVSNYTAGNYPVLLEVTNSHGDTVQVELNVVVQDKNTETVTISLTDYLVYVPLGDRFDPYAYIRSVEHKNGTRTDIHNVDVLGSVDTDRPGSYQLSYSYESGGAQGKTFLTVVVEGEE